MKKLHALIVKIEPPHWVCLILGFVILFRVPSLFEPYYYGDEMIYLTLGNALKKGLTLYSQIHDNKPPLLYLLGALAGNLFWFKAILMFWMLATIIIFWHLTKELFAKNDLGQKIAVVFFAIFTTIPLLEGNIVNSELFLIGPIILGILILIKNTSVASSLKSYKAIFLAGVSFAVAVLFKVPAIFDLPVVVIFWLITTKDAKNLIDIIKKTLVLALGFVFPIVLTLIWYFFKGALTDYIKAAFLENIGYLSSWNRSNVSNVSFVTKNGPLIIRAGVVVIGLIILRLYQSKLSRTFLIATIWLLTSLFAVTLSERPYPHYLIQAIPAISILVAILVSSKKFEQVLVVIPLTLAIFVPVYYHFWLYPTTSYYQRFLQYSLHQTTKDEYLTKFNPAIPQNYKLATSIQNLSMPNDKVFVWGNDAPTIYALARRLPPIKYVADYHITDFSSFDETLKTLKSNPPTLVVILPSSPTFPDLKTFLTSKYIEINTLGGEIWHLPTN